MSAEAQQPIDGDPNRASMLNSFTWILCSFSMVFFGLRMYTRARLTRNLWWDDWFITISVVGPEQMSEFIFMLNG